MLINTILPKHINKINRKSQTRQIKIFKLNVYSFWSLGMQLKSFLKHQHGGFTTVGPQNEMLFRRIFGFHINVDIADCIDLPFNWCNMNHSRLVILLLIVIAVIACTDYNFSQYALRHIGMKPAFLDIITHKITLKICALQIRSHAAYLKHNLYVSVYTKE